LIPTITGVAGQLLLKIGMTQLGVLELSLAALPNLIWRVITSPQVIIGLAIYLGGVFFWLLALNRAELSFVYPFASLSYVLITIVSWGILHEHVSPQRWLAMLIICLGVIMVVRS
jgi:drug/metabolite transporter (DMT)-like permease